MKEKALFASIKPSAEILGLFEEVQSRDAEGLGKAEILERAERYLVENSSRIDLKRLSRKPGTPFSGALPSSFKVRINDTILDCRVNEIIKKDFGITRIMTPFKLRLVLSAYLAHLAGEESLERSKEGDPAWAEVIDRVIVLTYAYRRKNNLRPVLEYLEGGENLG